MYITAPSRNRALANLVLENCFVFLFLHHAGVPQVRVLRLDADPGANAQRVERNEAALILGLLAQHVLAIERHHAGVLGVFLDLLFALELLVARWLHANGSNRNLFRTDKVLSYIHL